MYSLLFIKSIFPLLPNCCCRKESAIYRDDISRLLIYGWRSRHTDVTSIEGKNLRWQLARQCLASSQLIFISHYRSSPQRSPAFLPFVADEFLLPTVSTYYVLPAFLRRHVRQDTAAVPREKRMVPARGAKQLVVNVLGTSYYEKIWCGGFYR